jgi:hypothetical protein
MATLTTADDLVQDVMDRLEDLAPKQAAWLQEHVDHLIEIVKCGPDDETSRRNFLTFCEKALSLRI